MMITIRQMRYFEALATTGHFGKAAEMVNVSQPALSAQIAEMEAALGVKLVERSRAGTYLTEEGEGLLPKSARSFRASTGCTTGRANRAQHSKEGCGWASFRPLRPIWCHG